LGAKGIDFGIVGAKPSSMILVFWLDFNLVVCWVKNENHGFAKLAGLNPHKFLQSDVGEVWDQKELILGWLVQNQVQLFWCFCFIL